MFEAGEGRGGDDGAKNFRQQKNHLCKRVSKNNDL